MINQIFDKRDPELRVLMKKNKRFTTFNPESEVAMIMSLEERRANREGFEFNKSKYIRKLIIAGFESLQVHNEDQIYYQSKNDIQK